MRKQARASQVFEEMCAQVLQNDRLLKGTTPRRAGNNGRANLSARQEPEMVEQCAVSSDLLFGGFVLESDSLGDSSQVWLLLLPRYIEVS